MKKFAAFLPLAMIAGAPVISAPAFAQAAQAPAAAPAQKAAPKPSSKVVKFLVAMATAAKAKDAAAFAAAIPPAKANATNPGDHYLVGMLMVDFGLTNNDTAMTAAAIDQIAQSNYLSAPEVADLYKGLGGTYSGAKQYDLAAAAFEKGVARDPNNVGLLTSLAETRFAAEQVPQGIDALRKAIAASNAAGAKAPENFYKRAVGMAFNAKLPVTSDIARDWVRAYPNADSWHNALAIHQNMTKRTPALSYEIYKLMAATNSLTAEDYPVYAALAFDAGNFAEARSALDAGLAAGKIDASKADIKELTAALKVKAKPTMADLATAAKAVSDAPGRARVADRYMGIGGYAEAAALYRAADGQPGVDSDLIRLHLGTALAKAGDKAGAKAALASVGGAWKPIADFWTIYVDQKA